MVHTLCSTPRADNTCKDTNFFLNIRKGEAENFAMAGFLVRRTRIGMQVGARGPDLHGVRGGREVAVWLLVEDGVNLFRAGRHLGGLLEAPLLLREVLQVPQLLEEAPFGVDANFLGEGLGDVHGLPTRGQGRELAVGIDEAGFLQALPVDLCALGGEWLWQVL